ncbi:MAG: 2-methylaconitate cis-trans isomerase PrpF family protein [Burkholderiaceae bacterium]
MTTKKIRAVYMRGGTSKGLVFNAADLPDDQARWDALFCNAMGSPDPDGRQLNGMGGGLSSLSKVCVVGPPSRADADIDFTFGQVLIREARVDYAGNCGNMSSAIGPFAVEEGLVAVDDGPVTLRIHNTNTRKIIHSTFEVRAGRPVEDGDLAIPGVGGAGAPIRLEFIEPGGAITGHLLPTGDVVDELDVDGVGRIDVSMIDAGNACAFVRAESLGLTGTETPEMLEKDVRVLEALLTIRAHASVAMGICPSLETARARVTTPSIGIVAPPQAWTTLAGERLEADAADVSIRMISSNQPHRALPLTASLCSGVAACVHGSLVHAATRTPVGRVIRLGMPSGVLQVSAEVRYDRQGWWAASVSFYRTARRLFEGSVCA